MMRMNNIKMETVVERCRLLETLRANLERHGAIVREAVEGYVAAAKRAVLDRLDQLKGPQAGRVTLSFSLSPPQDYSDVYRTTIKMLEWSTEEKVTLQADEFRQLVLDQWDWSDSFINSNKAYSKTARDLAGE